ncbi:Argininosuccinate synthase [Trichinella pseudospiralis]
MHRFRSGIIDAVEWLMKLGFQEALAGHVCQRTNSASLKEPIRRTGVSTRCSSGTRSPLAVDFCFQESCHFLDRLTKSTAIKRPGSDYLRVET